MVRLKAVSDEKSVFAESEFHTAKILHGLVLLFLLIPLILLSCV